VVVEDVSMDADLAVEAQTSEATYMYVHAQLDVCIHLSRFEFDGWSGRVEVAKLMFCRVGTF
jgi:hypothetical protein